MSIDADLKSKQNVSWTMTLHVSAAALSKTINIENSALKLPCVGQECGAPNHHIRAPAEVCRDCTRTWSI